MNCRIGNISHIIKKQKKLIYNNNNVVFVDYRFRAKEEEKKVKKNIADVSVTANTAQETEMQQVIALLKDIQSKLSLLLDKVA